MNYLSLLWNFFRLRGNTKKSHTDMKNIQERKLRQLLQYTWEHSTWHRQRFEKTGITHEQLATLPLSAFPSMSKQDLLTHFDELVTTNELHQEGLRRFDEIEAERKKTYLGKYHVVHSSGSTGKPGYFVYDKTAWGQMLLGIIRGALWNMSIPSILGLLMKGPRILYIAATEGRYGGAMAVGDGVDGLHAQQLFLDINQPLGEWIGQVQEFGPNLIIGYPSAIKILGELKEDGALQMDILRVISCGEPLGVNLRRYLEETFQAEVVNFYGASESLALGVETGDSGEMVLFDDLNIIEVENGQMYLTCLYNFVQPLIRYKISDRLILKPAEADSRFPFTSAELLLGREEDALWFEDENGDREFLHPLAIEGFCIDGLRDFQFQQTGVAEFEMLAEVAGEKNKEYVYREMMRWMSSILQEKGLSYVEFAIRFVETIFPDPRTGKKKLILKDAINQRVSA